MLIYLDAQLVQYCADYEGFLFGWGDTCPPGEPRIRRELHALRNLVHLEQFGDWSFAVPEHLLIELHRGRPTPTQRQVYAILEDALRPKVQPCKRVVQEIARDLLGLNLKDRADRWHLAIALALGASWFITNDNDIIAKTHRLSDHIPTAQPYLSNALALCDSRAILKLGEITWDTPYHGGKMRVARPSQCLSRISEGLFLR